MGKVMRFGSRTGQSVFTPAAGITVDKVLYGSRDVHAKSEASPLSGVGRKRTILPAARRIVRGSPWSVQAALDWR